MKLLCSHLGFVLIITAMRKQDFRYAILGEVRHNESIVEVPCKMNNACVDRPENCTCSIYDMLEGAEPKVEYILHLPVPPIPSPSTFMANCLCV